MKALALLAQMEEFSQSRYRLESRYQHVLVDELQDTSRAAVAAGGAAGAGLGRGRGRGRRGPGAAVASSSSATASSRSTASATPRSAVLDEAAPLHPGAAPEGEPRQSIVRSFRAVPALQLFVNDVCDEIVKAPERSDAFRYGDLDRFPVPTTAVRDASVGLVAMPPDTAGCARAVAAEVARLLGPTGDVVRDWQTGEPRATRPGDVAVLFRSRDSHREFERELERLGVPFYVYKGLGFFDAEEVKDVDDARRRTWPRPTATSTSPRSSARGSCGCRTAR